MDAEVDQAALACLPLYASQFGALLQRPGLTSELHAAEPYAAASLVTAVLQATHMLASSPSAERGTEECMQLHGTAGHCLE